MYIWWEQRSLPVRACSTDIRSVEVRGNLVAKDDSAAPKPLAFSKEEQRPEDHAPVIFNSRTTSGSLGRTPLDDLMLRPNVHALHPFSANHLHKEGTEKVNYNHLVQSREQREHILYSRINCPGSKCHSGESCNETGEKPQTVEETPGEKRKRKN